RGANLRARLPRHADVGADRGHIRPSLRGHSLSPRRRDGLARRGTTCRQPPASRRANRHHVRYWVNKMATVRFSSPSPFSPTPTRERIYATLYTTASIDSTYSTL